MVGELSISLRRCGVSGHFGIVQGVYIIEGVDAPDLEVSGFLGPVALEFHGLSGLEVEDGVAVVAVGEFH